MREGISTRGTRLDRAHIVEGWLCCAKSPERRMSGREGTWSNSHFGRTERRLQEGGDCMVWEVMKQLAQGRGLTLEDPQDLGTVVVSSKV